MKQISAWKVGSIGIMYDDISSQLNINIIFFLLFHFYLMAVNPKDVQDSPHLAEATNATTYPVHGHMR